ncbi:axoneme-associated protein mst101, putative [Perkinsus marinus ATCC 50983]|uniref:Axoneme-associated protein mst101, putative n=1 Tax=Perkinsus marinus (strain ATCC 50983 / TXsc) TaxID=423536 RepID=C5KCT4_PERM5|nr:axoneme-associated protein mst101, putative [Perkinsus marinus ATCC 50983]EER17683.1 axoneme-associated protein mst101, putative [Perkinsus marinus ATCC 50983]|eukprot:XP_002785887.1 axoneme-associated protein mst101, putative [Perkinsus marinus ATCC 50983]
MSATAGLGALFAKKKKKVKSLNMTAKMKEEAKVEEAQEETSEEHGLEDHFTAIVSGAEPLVKTETKVVKTDFIAQQEEKGKDEPELDEQPEAVDSSEVTKKGWGKTPADVAAEVEEEEKRHEIEETEKLAAKKAEEAAKPNVYVPAYLLKMREQKKAAEQKERIRDQGLTPAQMVEIERKKKLAQQETTEKAKKLATAATASAANEEKKRQEREEAQRRKAELKEQVKKAMAAEESSKQITPQSNASKVEGSASYDQLVGKYQCRERRPVRPHAELDPCFLPPLQSVA